jgi:transcription antitermination protein NusB
LHPNDAFTQNQLVLQLRNNSQLKQFVSENKVNWVNQLEVIKNLYNKIREKDYFREYVGKKSNTYEDDKSLILKIIEEEVPAFQPLENTLEELSIFWNDDMEFILSMVFKTIKSFKQPDGPEKKLMPLFKNEDDREFVKKLFHKVILNSTGYNELIKNNSQNWEFDRIAIMDILIMRMALAEIIEFPSIPVKVSLNEYIEIAKDYSTSNSNTFINGILDNIVKHLKKENKIIKTGRGLIET